MDGKCGDCYYAELSTPDQGVAEINFKQRTCKRFPPQSFPIMGNTPKGPVVTGIVGMRPQVMIDDTCGEFEPNEEPGENPTTT